MRRTENPLPMASWSAVRKQKLRERISKRIQIANSGTTGDTLANSCWLGPPKFTLLGYTGRRVIYEMFRAKVPLGSILRNACGNPCCYHPNHQEVTW